MSSDSDKHFTNEQENTSDPLSKPQQLQLLHFAVQLQNIIPIDIQAKRFPIDNTVDMTLVSSTANIQLNLNDIAVDTETLQAQVSLEVHVTFPAEPRLFAMYFKLAGFFTYSSELETEMVYQFLQQGSLSVLLPYARELLLNLCNRLQVPMIVLPLVQISANTSSTQK